jgi:hypothetical protein
MRRRRVSSLRPLEGTRPFYPNKAASAKPRRIAAPGPLAIRFTVLDHSSLAREKGRATKNIAPMGVAAGIDKRRRRPFRFKSCHPLSAHRQPRGLHVSRPPPFCSCTVPDCSPYPRLAPRRRSLAPPTETPLFPAVLPMRPSPLSRLVAGVMAGCGPCGNDRYSRSLPTTSLLLRLPLTTKGSAPSHPFFHSFQEQVTPVHSFANALLHFH